MLRAPFRAQRRSMVAEGCCYSSTQTCLLMVGTPLEMIGQKSNCVFMSDAEVSCCLHGLFVRLVPGGGHHPLDLLAAAVGVPEGFYSNTPKFVARFSFLGVSDFPHPSWRRVTPRFMLACMVWQ